MAECGGRSEIAHAALSFSDRDKLTATVVALTDGNYVGRRGIYAGLRLELGPCAALEVGGVTVVVISHRVQCADPIFFGMRGSKSAGRARSSSSRAGISAAVERKRPEREALISVPLSARSLPAEWAGAS